MSKNKTVKEFSEGNPSHRLLGDLIMGETMDFQAMQKWNKIPKEVRRKVLDNVWCGRCLDAVTVVDYDMTNEDFGIVIRGKCKTCGGKVARVLEED